MLKAAGAAILAGAAVTAASAQPFTVFSGPVANSAESVTILLNQGTGESWFLAGRDGALVWLPLSFTTALAHIPLPLMLPWDRDQAIGSFSAPAAPPAAAK